MMDISKLSDYSAKQRKKLSPQRQMAAKTMPNFRQQKSRFPAGNLRQHFCC